MLREITRTANIIVWTRVIFLSTWIQSVNSLTYRGLYTSSISNPEYATPAIIFPESSTIQNLTYENLFPLLINISIARQQLTLELHSSSREFLSPMLTIERRREKADKGPTGYATKGCYFSGTVKGDKDSLVAISTCNGLAGIVQTRDSRYYIEPIHGPADTAVNLEHKHLIYKRAAVVANQPKHKRKVRMRNCGTKEPKRARRFRLKGKKSGKLFNERKKQRKHKLRDNQDKKIRHKRSISKKHYVEALVVADSSMAEFHEDGDLETYLLTIMNMVSALFKHPSLGNFVNLFVVKIIIIENTTEQNTLNVTTNAEQALKNFCKWQREQNPKNDSHPEHHDVAILITRKNLCSKDDPQCRTLGVAHISGMCDPSRSCSVNEDNGMTLAHTIAHELGHNFGMYHDNGRNGCFGKNGKILHVMTSNFYSDTNEVNWSRCSRSDITNFLDHGYGKCLYDEPTSSEYIYPDLPAGALYNANFQCHLEFGEESRSCTNPEDICSHLYCIVNSTCVTQNRPAAPGTNCGKHKWCHNQRCVSVMDPPDSIDGGWGEWSSWSECSRSCGAGVSMMERRCDHPSPAFGGRYCLGERRRYRVCNTEPCATNAPSFRAHQCTQFDQVEYEGKIYTWLPVEYSDPCKLYCMDVNGTVMVPWGDYAADGTPCNPLSKDMCISGVCRKVGCDWIVGSHAKEDVCGICRGDGTKCTRISKTYRRQSNSPGYKEVAVVPPGARNIRIEELGSTGNHISIGSAFKNIWYINGKRPLSLPGEYMIAGTQAGYTRDNQSEVVRIPGPIEEPIVIYFLFKGKRPNPGLQYSYSIWKPESTKQLRYSWAMGLWTQCSATCGGGFQHRIPVCKEYTVSSLGAALDGTSRIVDNNMCNPQEKPLEEKTQCNGDVCPSHWWVGQWQACTVTCVSEGEEPVRRRSIMCVDDEDTALPDQFCDREVKPSEFSKCNPLPLCVKENEV